MRAVEAVVFFGDSFSFVSWEQFVQMLRAFVANAKGYAFEIALDVVSSHTSQTFTELQTFIKEINKSSELIQAILTDPVGSVSKIVDTTSSLVATAAGLFTDYSSSRTKEEDNTPVSQQNNLSEDKKSWS